MYASMMLAPMMGFLMSTTKKMKTTMMLTMICSMMLFSSMTSTMMLYECMTNNSNCQSKMWNWMESDFLKCKMSLHMDLLSSSMLFMVTTISFFVHMYSLNYMKNDPHLLRFISYLSLFTFFMLMMMSSNNYLLLLMGWEGVGMCSYLLMNFWHTRTQANKAAMKAMLMNRMGDMCLLISMMMMMMKYGSMKFEMLLNNTNSNNKQWTMNTMTMLLLMSATSKSSLLGLHTWLPDAMEGPTPVSALMHAATMVTAGMFMLMRSSPLLESSKSSLLMTAWIGATTALFAATTGMTQNDIKRMMAYSTCSQLGYMTLAIGLSNYSMSLLHLMNHAFFKSLLFLGSGLAIHTMKNEQDIRKLSNLLKSTPMTYTSMLIGSLTLMGTPFLTAYFSKEVMLTNTQMNTTLYWLAFTTTSLTALYSTRLIYFSFMKSPQYKYIMKKLKTKHSQTEQNQLTNITLMLLTLSSISMGYMTYSMMTPQQTHMMTPQQTHMLPLICSMMGMLSTMKMMKHKLSNQSMMWTTFLMNAWNFNTVYNNMMTEKMKGMSHTLTYKHMDQGMLEKTGPYTTTNTMTSMTHKMSKMQSSHTPQHLSTMMMLYTSFNLYTLFFQETQ